MMKTTREKRKTARALMALTLPLALVLMSAASGAQEPASRSDRIRAMLEDFLEESGAPGVSVAWGRLGSPVRTATAGVVREAGGAPVSPLDRFHAGSIGKTFTAAAVLSLVLDGTLELDAPLGRWLSDRPWFARLPNGEEMTLRHLLSHTSGLRDHVDDSDFAAAVAEHLGGPEPDRDFAFAPEELVGFVVNDPPLFQPGADYAYSDTNYILLGLVVEAVTGREFYHVLRKRFLEPLGLNRTGPARTRAIQDLVTGYNPDGWLGLPEVMVQDGKLMVHPASSWTAGGMVSTPSDLTRWILALAKGRTALGREGFELMRTGAPSGARGRYGLGLSLGSTPHGSTLGHDGVFPGYRARMAYYPEHELAISVMTNQNPADPGRLANRIAAVVLDRADETDATEAPSSLPCPGSSGQGLSGSWPIRIALANGREIRGTLEVSEGSGGVLEGRFTQAGILQDGELSWTLEGRRGNGRFELTSAGRPRGPAAGEMDDVDAVIFQGSVTEEGISGEYFLVLQGRRYDKDATFRVSRKACRR